MHTISKMVLLCGLLLWANPSQATIFFDEGFENHLWTGSNGNPWDTAGCGFSAPDGCNPSIQTDLAVTGTHALRGDYNGISGGTFFDRTYTQTDNIYWRIWERMSANWTWKSNEQVKGFNLGDNQHYPNWWIGHFFGSSAISAQMQGGNQSPCPGGQPEGACMYQSLAPQGNDIWYCQEGHIQMNTPGVADGVIEFWMNGGTNPTNRYTNQNFRPAVGSTGVSGVGSSAATFSMTRLYVQGIAAVGNKYYDNFAVGNARIGCGGTIPPGDTTPPGPPTGVGVD